MITVDKETKTCILVVIISTVILSIYLNISRLYSFPCTDSLSHIITDEKVTNILGSPLRVKWFSFEGETTFDQDGMLWIFNYSIEGKNEDGAVMVSLRKGNSNEWVYDTFDVVVGGMLIDMTKEVGN